MTCRAPAAGRSGPAGSDRAPARSSSLSRGREPHDLRGRRGASDLLPGIPALARLRVRPALEAGARTQHASDARPDGRACQPLADRGTGSATAWDSRATHKPLAGHVGAGTNSPTTTSPASATTSSALT
jgi:hypothetical protein